MHHHYHRRRLLTLACLAAMSGTAFAQQTLPGAATQADPKRASDLEAINVTGTRISNINVISAVPTTVMTAEDIKSSGAVNVGDLLTTMPQLASTYTMGNSTRYIGTAGVQKMDLRNLGSARSLVLVNGRRFVGASAGDTSVDVNMIPVAWIERVEVITGGASAVYGADAVTGVVNFILKKNYQGAQLSAQYGDSEHGGYSPRSITLSGGMNFAQNRGNIAASVEHAQSDNLEFPDRFGNKSYSTIKTPNGPTDTALFNNAGSYTITNGGTFSLGRSTELGKRYVFNPDGSVRSQRFDGIADDTGRCQDCDRLDTNQVLELMPKYNRTTVNGVATFDITPEQHLYAEGTYSNNQVKVWRQPAFGSGGTAYIITRDNPYISPSLASLMDANGKKSLAVSRFDVDAGRRGEDTSRNTSRIVLGSNGVITGDWQYDGYVDYGVTDETRHNLNNRIRDRFNASIDAVRDPSTGNIVCRSTLNPNAINVNAGRVLDPIALGGGCVPTSIFGTGAIDPAAAQWFNTTTTTKTHLTQFVGGGTVTNNNLFQMPWEAGAASLVGGAEFRRETSRQDTDPLDQQGLTFLNAIPSSSGAYNVKEGFIEFAAPLITGRTGAQSLSFDTAARFSDYSSFGHTKAWRWGLDWSITSDVRLRGTMSTAVRVPNIDELYSGQTQNYFSVTDPCSTNQIKNGKDPSVRAANCLALGVPSGWTSSNSATIPGLSGSNPDLQPETGKTWTAGIVLTPTFLEGLSLSADYWNIKLTNAISSPSGQQTANNCVDSTTGINTIYCQSALRDAVTHELNYISTIEQNISELSTSGIDFNVNYGTAIGNGRFNTSLNATRVIAYTEHPFQIDPTYTIQDNGVLGFPEWKATLYNTYGIGSWAFNWNIRYFSSMLRVTNESYASNPTQTTPIRAGAGFFNDAKVSYSVPNSGWQIYGGITNVFDRNPPTNIFGTTFGGGLYDAIGRAYYAGFNYKF
ncbi:TonB-dependent receptor [Dyella sp. C11]|uniref:TonB-dependent receptor domain-containing protein n=1 Tax=Dyella sp. C11 TaxID=2126991 RepID=UPI000D645615|nr:TonB-dependent receptor [Dyella sp. C11]